jgi:hypothetical protein
MDQSDAADRIAQSALNSIQDILHDLPEQVEQARKLPRDVEDTSKVTSQVSMHRGYEFEVICCKLQRNVPSFEKITETWVS